MGPIEGGKLRGKNFQRVRQSPALPPGPAPGLVDGSPVDADQQ